jgi:hypothetical protein
MILCLNRRLWWSSHTTCGGFQAGETPKSWIFHIINHLYTIHNLGLGVTLDGKLRSKFGAQARHVSRAMNC